MGQTVTVEQLLDTYKRNKKECLEFEYSDWVKAIDRALLMKQCGDSDSEALLGVEELRSFKL